MNLTELKTSLEKVLSPILEKSGSIVFSSASSITKGDLFILGLNPGGESPITIKQVLNDLPFITLNAYLDENWGNRKNQHYKMGQHPLQKNYIGLIKALGFDPRSVFSSNLIFTRSRNQEGANYPSHADICWPAHKEFIRIVDPDHILVFGNSKISPYQYIKNKYSLEQNDWKDSGHGSWSCYFCSGEIEGRKRSLIGVPHLSRYYITYHEDVIDWIKSKINIIF